MDKTQLSQLPVPLRRGPPVRSRDDNNASIADSNNSISSSNNMAQCRTPTECVDSTAQRRQPVHSPTAPPEHLLIDSPPQRPASKQQLRGGGGLSQSRSPKRCGRSTTEDAAPPTTTATLGGPATQLAAIAAVHARSGTVSPVSDASSIATSLSAADSDRTPEMYRKASTEFCRFDQLQKLKGCSGGGGSGEKTKKKSGFFGAGKSGSPSRHRPAAAVDDFYQSFRGSPIVATEIFPPDVEDVYTARKGRKFPATKPQSITLSPERSKVRPVDVGFGGGGDLGGVDAGDRKYDAIDRLRNFVGRDVAADQSGRRKKSLEKRSADGAEIIEEAGRENDNRNGGSPIYHELDPPGVYRFPTVHHTYQSIVEIRDELESLRLRSPPSVDFQRSVADQPSAMTENSQERESRSPLSRAKSVQELGQKASTPSKLSLFSRIRFTSKNKASKVTAESGSGSRSAAGKAVPPPSLPLPHPPAQPAQSGECRLAGQRSLQDRNELSPPDQFFDEDEEDQPTSPHRRQPSFSTFMGRTQYLQQQQQYVSTPKPSDQTRAQKSAASGIYSVVYIPHSSDDKTTTVPAAPGAGAVSPPPRNSSLTRPSTSTNTYASSRRHQPSSRPALEHIYQPILGGFGGSPKLCRGQAVDSPTGNEPLYRQKFLKIASVHSLCSPVNGSQLHGSTSLGNLLLPSENCRSPTLVDGARSALRPMAADRQRLTPTAFDDYYAVAGNRSTSKRPSIAITSSPAQTPPAVMPRASRSIRAGISPCRAAAGNSAASSSSAFASPSCGVRMAEMRVAVRRVVCAGSSDVGGSGSAASSRSPSATGVDATPSGSGHASTPIPSSAGRLSVFQFHVPPPTSTSPSSVTSHLPRRAFRDVSSQTTISVRPAASCSVLNVSSHSTVSGSSTGGAGRQMHTIQEEEQQDGAGGETLIVVGAAVGSEISGASSNRQRRLDRDVVGLSQRRRKLTAAASDDAQYKSAAGCRQDATRISTVVNDENLLSCSVPHISVVSSCQHSSKADRRLIRSPVKISSSSAEWDARGSPGRGGNNGETTCTASLLDAGDMGQKASRLRRPSPAKSVAAAQQSTVDHLAPSSPSALSSSSSSSASAQTNIDHRLLTAADRRSEFQQQQQQQKSVPTSASDATAFSPSRLQSTRSASSPRTPRDRPTSGRNSGVPARAASAGAPQSPGPRGHTTSIGSPASRKPSRTAPAAATTTVTERHQTTSLNNDRANGFHAAAAAVVSAAAAEAIENNKSVDSLSVPDGRSATGGIEAHCSAVTTTRPRPTQLLTSAHAKQTALQQQQLMSTSTSTAPSSSLSSSSTGSLVSAADCSESDELSNSLTTSGDLTAGFVPSSSRSPRDLVAGERDSTRTEDSTLASDSSLCCESPVSLTGSTSCSNSTEKSRTFLPKMSATVSSAAAFKNKSNKKSATNGTSR